MKSFYNNEGIINAKTCHTFCKEIEDAIKPILDRYIKKGYNIRELSHEAHSSIGFLESFHLLDTAAKLVAKRREKRKIT